LQKKKDGWMVIPQKEGQTGNKKVRFVPVRLRNGRGPNGEDPESGTVNKGTGRCIFCGQAIESEEIKRQARGESAHGTWSDELYCVVGVREQPKLDKKGNIQTYASGPDKGKVKTEKVMFFREPVKEDIDALARAKKALDENWERWDKMGLIPTEKLPEGYNTNQIRGFGVYHWFDMFTPRQLLGHLTAEETLMNMASEIISTEGKERGTAIIHYLQYMIDKCLDYNSRQTRWEYTRGVVKGTFGRHDFSLKWTFGELIYSGDNSGLEWGKSQVLDAYKGICELLGGSKAKPAEVLHGSAANLSVEDKSVDIICVDPPYYNNVQYAELSDYFYVWQKRTFGELYPDIFNRRLTNKRDEAVANPVRDGSAKEANVAYEQRMGEIFAECRRVLKDDGILTMMFTHKVDISKFVKEGNNKIKLGVIVSNRNLLGPFHNVYAEEDLSVGPETFERFGQWKDGKCPHYVDRYSFVKNLL
jgi:adenine-specific DNA methylase